MFTQLVVLAMVMIVAIAGLVALILYFSSKTKQRMAEIGLENKKVDAKNRQEAFEREAKEREYLKNNPEIATAQFWKDFNYSLSKHAEKNRPNRLDNDNKAMFAQKQGEAMAALALKIILEKDLVEIKKMLKNILGIEWE